MDGAGSLSPERVAEAEREAHLEATRERARIAYERGRAAAETGALDEAAIWLDRAHRLARADPTISFSLALVRLRRGDPRGAAALLLPIARSVGTREAWLGLAIARRLQGLGREAAHMLEEAVVRHAIDRDDAAALTIAASIAAEAGMAGWCGMDADGAVLIHLVEPGLAVAAALDGKPFRLRPTGPATLEARLDAGWSTAGAITVTAARGGTARPLIGGRIELASIMRVDGCVEADPSGDLIGWATCFAAPSHRPTLALLDRDRRPVAPIAASDAEDRTLPGRPFGSRLFGFRLRASDLPDGPVHVVDAHGRDLPGSPVDPGLERRAAAASARASAAHAAGRSGSAAAADPAFLPLPAGHLGTRPALRRSARRPCPVDIVIPVYRGLARTLDCLDAVAATVPRGTVVHVVDDASPDPELVAALAERAARRAIRLHAWPDGRNRGFPAAANAGIAAAAGRDVILLNSDTFPAGDWFARLRASAYAAPDIGSATPLTNEGSIFAIPRPNHSNEMPGADETRAIAAEVARVNDGLAVEVPTGNGFCMFLRRDCLDEAGAFRTDLFAQGYGEENDFCLRSRHLGWRHVAALDVYVAHAGGTSFKAGRSHLMARNLAILERLHPGYHELIARFVREDPLAPARRRIDEGRLLAGSDPHPRRAVLLVTHQAGGGVERQVRARIRAIQADGHRAIVLRGDPDGIARDLVVVAEGLSQALPSLRYRLPDDAEALRGLLGGMGAERIELHHLLGHSPLLPALLRGLSVPIEAHLHDYAWFCHRIALVGPTGRYCGEPPVEGCRECVAMLGSRFDPEPDVDALLAASAATLAASTLVVVPSADAGTRLRAHFPQARPIEIRPWESEKFPAPSVPARPDAAPALTVAVVGAIGPEKGLRVLLACAADARRRNLAIRFVVIGHSSDDDALLGSGPVFVTGPYDEDEAQALIAAQGADIAFLPSVWPETWCFALSEAWRAGLAVAAFDLGTQAERIRARGGGLLLPLETPAGAVNDALLAFGRALAPATAASHDDARPTTRTRPPRAPRAGRLSTAAT